MIRHLIKLYIYFVKNDYNIIWYPSIILDLNEEIQNKIVEFVQYHDDMKNILELANEMNTKAVIEEKKNAIRLQNALNGNIIVIFFKFYYTILLRYDEKN